MRVLVCGSRNWQDLETIFRGLRDLGPIEVVIEGEAPGADRLAAQAAHRLGITVLRFPADWDRYGKAAGPIRNQQMLDEGRPDLVLAYPLPDSRGTWDMVRRAVAAGIEVRVKK
jgi:hypothetical protein